MSGAWNHAMCDPCWNAKNPDRRAVRTDSELEICCWCESGTRSGIYVRADPNTLSCKGVHLNEAPAHKPMAQRLLCYDREGKLITTEAWARLRQGEGRPEYVVVEQTTLPDGRWLSTVWMGIDHNLPGAWPPLIFETMLFDEKGGNELDQRRYPTEEEARQGHARMLADCLLEVAH